MDTGSGIATEGESLAAVGASRSDILALFLRLLPPAFFAQIGEPQPMRRQHNRVYNDAVVIWLMLVQRLLERGSLEAAVVELGRGLPQDFWPRPCRRLCRGTKMSGNTAAYNEARQRLPLRIVEQSADRVFQEMLQQVARPGKDAGRPAVFIDGSSMRMPHSETLAAKYPPGSNQHGKSHWPLVRIVVAHDLYSGLAMRPEWGALNGEQAVSEQGLLEQAIERLPSGCVVLGDANFGVFSVAYAATGRGHPVVLRLTLARARHLAGEEVQDGMDRRIRWTPSRDDRRKHLTLPDDAGVEGRLIVRRVQPSNGKSPFLLALFTTLEEPKAVAVVQLYGYRWNIETDLRSLKQALRLDQLTSTTPAMVAKEIDVAMMAYNLVRAVICAAAEQTGLEPRRFGFTRVRNIVNAFAPLIASAADPRQAQELSDKMMYYVRQAKLPRRKRGPSPPRAVWPKPHKYPKRHE